MIHRLKTDQEAFHAIWIGDKNFEFRKNDRNFKVNDFLLLMEYKKLADRLTGLDIQRRVKYILHGPDYGIPEGYCIMDISPENNDL